jgi:hypothetical protein
VELECKTTVVHAREMSRLDPQLKIRLPRPLKIWLEASARANGRSLNAEIVQLIQRAKGEVPSATSSPLSHIAARLDELSAEVANLKRHIGTKK